jgi:hypothetical protein
LEKPARIFSMVWKNSSVVFQALEKAAARVSNPWKTGPFRRPVAAKTQG